MNKYFYHRQNGTLVLVEADQLFWSGKDAVFVRNAQTMAIICLLPGEFIFEQNAGKEITFGSIQASDSKSPS